MALDNSHQNLRGRNFQGEDLAGANFSSADIRGANFTNANLIGANFSHAKAGLQGHCAFFLVGVSWLLSGISGLFSISVGLWISFIFDSSSSGNHVFGWIALVTIIVLFIVILRQGLNSAVAEGGAFALAGAGALAGALDGAF
ncbi:MAG: pentapeptide repeat-containing protein, partial [Nostoc sp.]|uniref:pentapeptide repeat-containing protein n=1 Tax=Nostoc sp. TaxID=1180 RepID=UPI002FF8EC71